MRGYISKVKKPWMVRSIMGIFYMIIASMFVVGCSAVYVVGMIATGYFGVEEFNLFVEQVHHYRNQALIVATGGVSTPVLWNGGKALLGLAWAAAIRQIAAEVKSK